MPQALSCLRNLAYGTIMHKAAHAAIAAALLMCASAASAGACLRTQGPLTQAQTDENARLALQRSPELFEGEIIGEADRRGLRVTRVFTGQLQPGMTLWAASIAISLHDCGRVPPRLGDKGIVMTAFGRGGPLYVDSFLNEATVDALRRSNALPPQ